MGSGTSKKTIVASVKEAESSEQSEGAKHWTGVSDKMMSAGESAASSGDPERSPSASSRGNSASRSASAKSHESERVEIDKEEEESDNRSKSPTESEIEKLPLRIVRGEDADMDFIQKLMDQGYRVDIRDDIASDEEHLVARPSRPASAESADSDTSKASDQDEGTSLQVVDLALLAQSGFEVTPDYIGSLVDAGYTVKNAPKSRTAPATDWEKGVMTGRIDLDMPSTIKVVRIFTSSTFTDTRVERNMLMEQVYPRLKTFCQEKGYQFQVVDMRWGVRDDISDDHLTADLCMKELTACQKLSTGPNFITFLSQKYGYRPFPPKLEASELEKLMKVTDARDDLDMLDKWWVKDENARPAVYLLQPISSRIPDYASSDRDKQDAAWDQWAKEYERLQEILRHAADKVLTGLPRHKYYMSVTEDEITNGILQATDPGKHCYWFKRNIADLPNNTGDKLARKYMDISRGAVDHEALQLLGKLKDERIPEVLPASNIRLYELKWSENGVDKKREDHTAYLKQFGDDFYSTLTGMIDKGVEERQSVDRLDKNFLEVMRHATFAQEKLKSFIGRQTVLDEIRGRLTAPRNDGCALVLLGEPGCGKTSLMCRVQQLLPEWLGDSKVHIIARYIGTTGESSTIRQLLHSIALQLKSLGLYARDVPEDYRQLSAKFPAMLEAATVDRNIVLLLDSLDQLSDADNGREMDWITEKLPRKLTLVLSTIPGARYKVEPNLRDLFTDKRTFFAVPHLKEQDLEPMGQEYLRTVTRTLSSHQMSLVTEACKSCRTPLFLKLAFDQASRWKSYTPPDLLRLEQTVPDIIALLFSQLEHLHGSVFVGNALAVVTASQYGVSVDELEDIMSLDDDALNDVYEHGAPPLRRLPPLLWVRVQADLKDYLVERGADNTQVIYWYHRQFVDVARKRYLQGEKRNLEVHKLLAEFFEGRWAIGTEKPFVDRKGTAGKADRFVAKQPLTFSTAPDSKPKDEKAEDDDQSEKEEEGSDEAEETEETEETNRTVYNLRKLNQLPYHLAMCRDLEGLKRHVFCNFAFLYHKVSVSGVDSIVDDFNMLEQEGIADKEISTVVKNVQMSRDSIIHDPKQLCVCLPGRLLNTDLSKTPHLQSLVAQALKPPYKGLIIKKGFMKSLEGSLLQKLAGHTDNITAFAVSRDNTRIAALGSTSASLKVWNIDTGRLLKQMTTERGYSNTLMFVKDDEWIIRAGSGDSLTVWDWMARHQVMKLELSYDPRTQNMCFFALDDAGKLLYSMSNSHIEAWTIPDFKQVMKVTYRKPDYPKDPVRDSLATPFLSAHGKEAVFKVGRSPVLNFFDLDAQTKDAEVKVSKTATLCKDDDKHSFLCCGTSNGLVVTFNYLVRKIEEGRGDVWLNLAVYNIATGQLVKKADHVMEMDYSNAGEKMWMISEDEVALSIYQQTPGLRYFNHKTSQLTHVLPMTGAFMHVAPAGPKRVATLDTATMLIVQVHSTERAISNSDLMNKWTVYPSFAYRLPSHNRYCGYITAEHVCVEDLAAHKTVRRVGVEPGLGSRIDMWVLVGPKTAADLKVMKDKLHQLVDHWLIYTTFTRLNVIVFGAKAKLIANSAQHESAMKINKIIDALEFEDLGEVDILAALAMIGEKRQKLENPQIKKGVLVMTNSPLKNADAVAKKCQEMGRAGYGFVGVFAGAEVSAATVGGDVWTSITSLRSIRDMDGQVVEEIAMRTCMRLVQQQTVMLSPTLAVSVLTSGLVISLDLKNARVLHSLGSFGYMDVSKPENSRSTILAVDERRVGVILGKEKKNVCIFDAITGQCEVKLTSPKPVVLLRISHNKKVLVGFPTGKDGAYFVRSEIIVWDLQTKQMKPTLQFGQELTVSPSTSNGSFDILPDGSAVFIACGVDACRFDTNTGKRTELPKRYHVLPNVIAYAKAADCVVTSYYKDRTELSLLHPKTLKLRTRIRGPQQSGALHALHMGPEGRLCATNGLQFSSIVVYNLVNPSCLGIFFAEGSVLSCVTSGLGGILSLACMEASTLVSVFEYDPDSGRPDEDEVLLNEPEVYPAEGGEVEVAASLTEFLDRRKQ